MLENGFVLLEKNTFDMEQLINELEAHWQVRPEGLEHGDGSLMFFVGSCLCSIAIMPASIPNGEAEQRAKLNYYCSDAVDIAKKHQAHLMVTVMDKAKGREIEGMELYSKIVAACLAQACATGVYTSGTVFAADFYRQVCSQYLNAQSIPVMIWVFVGIGQNAHGNQLYTIGMEKFGKKEMEILNAKSDMQTLHTALLSMCDYIITSDLVLQDGESIGFSDDQKWAINLSQSVYANSEESLKISVS